MAYKDNNEKAVGFGEAEVRQLQGKMYLEDQEIQKLDREVVRLQELMLKVHAKKVTHELKREEHAKKMYAIQDSVDILNRPRISFDMSDSSYAAQMTKHRKIISEYTGTDTFL